MEQCAASKGSVVDQLKQGCSELHLVCMQKIIAKKTADEFLDSTARDLKSRCADALGISLKDMGNGVMDGKVPWRYLNPEIPYGEVVDERDGQVYKTVERFTTRVEVWLTPFRTGVRLPPPPK